MKSFKKYLDKPTFSINSIAKKHNVSLAMLKKQLGKGIQVELEHTNDKNVAKEIALDHLNELPNYYTKLKQIEQS